MVKQLLFRVFLWLQYMKNGDLKHNFRQCTTYCTEWEWESNSVTISTVLIFPEYINLTRMFAPINLGVREIH